jgi:hypothetical protein
MYRMKLLPAAALIVATALMPAAASSSVEEDSGSNRKVLSCNVDGTYTCANEKCIPGYCCQIGG